jgi:hypothetical protein
LNLLSDVVTYIRRIVKTASSQALPDSLIIDYINRFYTYDLPARLQLFELKTKYNLETAACVDKYNMPYDTNGNLLYQGLQPPIYVDGVQINLILSRDTFFKAYPDFRSNTFVAEGDGSTTNFSVNLNNTVGSPLIRAHLSILTPQAIEPPANGPNSSIPSNLDPGIYISAFDVNNNIMIVYDNGTFQPSNQNVGNLGGAGTGTINYITGHLDVTFQNPPINQGNIEVQCLVYQPGTPRIVNFFNNIITIRPVPDRTYLMEFDAYLTPAAFLGSGQSLPFGYMSEYLARGAARKILSDTGDVEQFAFYEPLFREQENLVIRRTDRQNSINRTPTIFTDLYQQNPYWGTGQQA